MAERGYRWGRFQAWGALLFAVAQFVIVHFPVSLFIGVFFLYLWTGLLRKRRYGFVLMYVTTGVAILAGLFHLAVEPTWDVFSQLVIAVCFGVFLRCSTTRSDTANLVSVSRNRMKRRPSHGKNRW